MKKISIVLLAFALFGFTIINTEQGARIGEEFTIQINDSTEIEVKQVISKTTNLPIYYYSDLYVPACNTGECKTISMKMYWDIYGNYYKYQVKKTEPLTKYNHEEFKAKEYVKLHLLLCDTASEFKTITFKNLTEKQAGKKYNKTDASSGATIKFINLDNIKGAVKTSHTLWHIANGKVQEEILKASNNALSTQKDWLLKIDNKTQDITTTNFSELSFLISVYSMKETKSEEGETYLKAIFQTDDTDKKMLVSNYYFRKDLRCRKAKKFIKSYAFVK